MPSGVKIKEISVGTGAIAERGKVVVIHYRIYLNRGEEISSTYSAGRPAHIHLGKREAIAGLEQGIEGMQEHGRRELEISPHLAYGEKGILGQIPPNAVLRFEVELLEVREPGVVKPEDYPARKQLIIMRAGEAARGLSQWQFGLLANGEAGGFIRKCPSAGTTWRHSKPKQFHAQISPAEAEAVFASVLALVTEHPKDLLGVEDLWADMSEKANNITRDQKNRLCVWVAVYEQATPLHSFYLPEDSPLMVKSLFYSVATKLVAHHIADAPHAAS